LPYILAKDSLEINFPKLALIVPTRNIIAIKLRIAGSFSLREKARMTTARMQEVE